MGEFSRALDALAEFEGGDGALVIAVGGGVVGDLSGFVAACYKRGSAWIQIPTTLLAQVDASVGGKTAIDHSSAKNLIGAFHQPRLVVADMDTLCSLDPRELRCGLAEVIKHGVILDRPFFKRIEGTIGQALRLDAAVLEDYVGTSCAIKASVVASDERDTGGQRALLNYGHTFGHAIELAAGFRYAHGEAVAIGMACAGDMAVEMGLLPADEANRIESVIGAAGLPVKAQGVSLEAVMSAMRLDKKCLKGANRFILAHSIGDARAYSNLPEDRIQAVVKARIA
jgi:3-dehydroquinate synthase